MRMNLKTTRGVLAGLALAAVAAVPVQAMQGGHGHGGFDGGMHSAAGGMFGGMLGRMLDRVNATPQQRTQIEQILKTNVDAMRAQRDSRIEVRNEALKLFAQPTVDANALEALRDKQMAQHIAASKRMTAAMLEISRVLTPEQRKQMTDYMQQRSDMMQRHQRERRGIEAPRS